MHRSIAGVVRKLKRIALACAVAAAYCGSLQAAVVTVDTVIDDVSASGCSLRAALINAEGDDQSGSASCAAGSGADTIRFASSLSGQTITLNGSALPTITKDLVIEGPEAGEADSIVIDGNDQSPILAVETVDDVPVDLTLRNLTLTRALGDLDGLGAAVRGGELPPPKRASDGFSFARDDEASAWRGGPIESPNIGIELTDVVVHNSVAGAGGGIGVVGGSLVLERSVVSQNAADFGAGGVLVIGELTLVDSLVQGNTAEGNGGGIVVSGSAVISGSVISGNVTTGSFAEGGGLSIGNASYVSMTDSELTGNETQGDDSAGGGLFVSVDPVDDSPDLEIELIETLVQNNRTAGADSHGGGIAVVPDDAVPGTVTLIETQVRDNVTTGIRSSGGGVATFGTLGSNGRVPVDLAMQQSIVADNATEGDESPGGGVSVEHGDAFVEQSTISGNSTAGSFSDGAGIRVFNDQSPQGVVELVNSTVSANAANGDFSVGGGVIASFETNAVLRHATLVDNVDLKGTGGLEGTGGVHLTSGVGTELVLENSLIVQTEAGSACDADNIDDSHVLATDTSCTGSATPAGQIEVGSLADYGGPTPTHALARSSVAVDAAGDCLGDLGIEVDQRGKPRPGEISAACDIGAFEHQTSGVLFRDRFE